MDLNKETPNRKAEKNAIKVLIEASGLECSPLAQDKSPELESWIHKKNQFIVPKRVPSVPVYQRSISNMGKPPIAPLVKIRNQEIRSQRSQGRGLRERSLRSNNQVLLVPLVFTANSHESKHKLPNAFVSMNKRSQSLPDCKENLKPAEIPTLKKVLSLMVKKNNPGIKISNENALIPKSQAEKIAKLLGLKHKP